MRYMLTDELWTILGLRAEQAKRYTCGQSPQLPERTFFEAVLYIGRTGIPWRDLPGECGSWDAVHNRFRRWVASGSLAKLFELLTEEHTFAEVKRILVDSTTSRAHRHAERAPKKRWRRRNKGLVAAAVDSRARSC